MSRAKALGLAEGGTAKLGKAFARRTVSLTSARSASRALIRSRWAWSELDRNSLSLPFLNQQTQVVDGVLHALDGFVDIVVQARVGKKLA